MESDIVVSIYNLKAEKTSEIKEVTIKVSPDVPPPPHRQSLGENSPWLSKTHCNKKKKSDIKNRILPLQQV